MSRKKKDVSDVVETAVAEVEPVEAAKELNVESMSDTDVDKYFEESANQEDELPEVETPLVPAESDNTTNEPEPLEPVVVAEDKEPEKPKEDTQVEANKNAALQEARKENRLLQKQLQELAEKNEKLLKTFETALQPKQVEPQVPDKDEDPIGYLQYQNQKLQARVDEIDKFKNMTVEQQEQHAKGQKFVNDYRYQLNQFASQTPDFNKAYDFALQSRIDEYKIFGLSEEAATKKAREDEAAFAYDAMQDGVNPAERIYQFAKLRGFQNNATLSSHPPKANGHAKVDATTKIEQIERGQRASRTLNETGTNPGNKMTVSDIANLSDKEFEKLDWDEDVLSLEGK